MLESSNEETQNAPPPHPRTKGKPQGKRSKGNPTHPEEEQSATRQAANRPRPGPGTPTKTTDTDKTRTRKHQTENERRRRNKKKQQVRERCLGECEEEDVRVEGGERVQDVETQGEPQTIKVWGSPAPEREKREKTSPTKRTRQKKKTDANKKPNTGRGLKGLKTRQETNPRDKNARQTTKEQRLRPEQKNKQRNHTRL